MVSGRVAGWRGWRGGTDANLWRIPDRHLPHVPVDTMIEDSEAQIKLKRWAQFKKKALPKVKILWTFTQLVSGFGFVLDVDFPEPYDTLVEALSSINLNILSVAPVACYYSDKTFLSDLVMTTMMPIGVSAVLLTLHNIKKRKAKPDGEQGQSRSNEDRGPYFELFLLLTYLVLVSTASKVCSSFKIDKFQVDEEDPPSARYYAAVDYKIEAPGLGSPCRYDGTGCDHGGRTYILLQIYAALMFAICE